MSITRISKIRGFNNLLGGRDLAEIFKDGHVYSFTNIAGEIMVKDLGEHADINQGSTFPTIMMNGTYLLTKEEDKLQKKLRDDD